MNYLSRDNSIIIWLTEIPSAKDHKMCQLISTNNMFVHIHSF